MGDQVPSVGFRRELLQATSEEELLSQQSEFLSKNSLPSAKVTRVKRKTAAESKPQPSQQGEESTGNLPDGADKVDLQGPDLSTIITEVVEKKTAPLNAEPPSLPPGGSFTPFPEATHRKMSKFALGRKSKKPPSMPDMSTTAPQPPQPVKDIIAPLEDAVSLRASTNTSTGDTPNGQLTSSMTSSSSPAATSAVATSMNSPTSSLKPTKSSLSSGRQGSKEQRRVTFGDDVVGGMDPVPPVLPEPPAGQEACTSDKELDSIDKQNRDQIAAMSEEERQEALTDLQSRLSPSMLEFLKKRGAKKLQGVGRVASGHQASTSSSSSSSAAAANSVLSNGSRQSHQTRSFTNPPPAHHGSGPSSSQKAATTSSGALGRKAPLADLFNYEDEADLEQEEDGGNKLDERLVARVRFDLDGEAVDVQQNADLSLEEQVLQRDALRQDEGIVPSDGYTAVELTVLARSSVSSQRVAALKLIATLLANAKPSVEDLDENGTLKPRPVQPPQGYTDKFSLDWSDVWRYMVADLGVATTIRVALDDTVSTVVASAAEALLVLVGAGAAEDVLNEVMESMPTAGWPKLRLAQLKRPHAAGLWECALETAIQQETEGQRGPSEPWSEEDQTPEELARTDPLAGLIQMSLLPRIRHILLNRTAPPAFPFLMAALTHLASCSSTAAEYISSYPGILDSLTKVAQSYPTPADEATHHQSKLAAMRLVRTLCQSSSRSAADVQSAGLLQYPQRILMMAKAEDGLDELLMQLEAMRTWRAATVQGIPLMNMDDMYPYIAHCMLPPPKDSAVDPQEEDEAFTEPSSGLKEARVEAMKWLLAAEGHLLLGSLLTHSACVHKGDASLGGIMISSGAAAAMVHEAREALTAAGLQRLHKLVSFSALHLFNTQSKHRGYIRLPHAALAVPTTTCSAAYTAAVMNCLAIYWQLYAQVLRPDQVHPPSPSSLQSVGLSHSWVTPMVPLQPFPTGPPSKPAPKASDVGGVLLGALLGLVTGAAVQEAPLSQIPRSAKLVSQAMAGSLLQAVLLLIEAHYPDSRERWSASRGLLVPIMEQLQLNASKRKYSVNVAQPWVLAIMQAQVPKLALLATAVRILRESWRAVKGAMVLQDGHQCAEQQLAVWCVDAVAGVLAVAPPGYEVSCLNLLAVGLSKPILGPLLTAADEALSQFADTPSVLQRAASGQTTHSTTQGAVVSSRPPTAPVEILSRYLFHSYAASWLAFLSANSEPQARTQPPESASDSAPSDSAPSRPAPQLHPAYVLSTAASRLPAPPHWMLKEAHALPQHLPALLQGQQPSDENGPQAADSGKTASSSAAAAAPLSSSSASSTAAGVNVVGAALMVSLGMEAAQSRYLQQLPSPLKLQCLLQLTYVFDVLELIPAELKPSVYTSWTDPNVRWPLAALTHFLVHGSFTAASTSSATPNASSLPQATSASISHERQTGRTGAQLSSSTQPSSAETSSTHTSSTQISSTQTSSIQMGSTETSSSQTGSTETSSPQTSSTQPPADTHQDSVPQQPASNITSSSSSSSITEIKPPRAVSEIEAESPGPMPASASSVLVSTNDIHTTAPLSSPALPVVLPSTWASSSLAEQITDIFVSSSMLDPLFECHMAMILMPPARAQTQTRRRAKVSAAQHAWNVMASEGVLHLIPRLEDCPGAPTAYEAVYEEESMLDLLVRTVSSGDLDKSYDMVALPAWLATRSLASSLVNWTQEDNVARLRAESRLRSVLRGASPAVVQQLFEEMQTRSAEKGPNFLREFVLKAIAPDPDLQVKAESLLAHIGTA